MSDYTDAGLETARWLLDIKAVKKRIEKMLSSTKPRFLPETVHWKAWILAGWVKNQVGEICNINL